MRKILPLYFHQTLQGAGIVGIKRVREAIWSSEQIYMYNQ
jgi:hypothetical protein